MTDSPSPAPTETAPVDLTTLPAYTEPAGLLAPPEFHTRVLKLGRYTIGRIWLFLHAP